MNGVKAALIYTSSHGVAFLKMHSYYDNKVQKVALIAN